MIVSMIKVRSKEARNEEERVRIELWSKEMRVRSVFVAPKARSVPMFL